MPNATQNTLPTQLLPKAMHPFTPRTTHCAALAFCLLLANGCSGQDSRHGQNGSQGPNSSQGLESSTTSTATTQQTVVSATGSEVGSTTASTQTAQPQASQKPTTSPGPNNHSAKEGTTAGQQPVVSQAMAAAAPVETASDIVTDLMAARLLQRPAKPTGITNLAEAYQTQNALMDRLIGATNPPIGYKVAFNSPEMQKKFGLHEPASGLLTLNMRRKLRQHINLGQFPRLVEVEVGLVIQEDIRERPQNIADLKRKVSGMRIVMEVPAIRFGGQPTGYDVIADNAGAEHIVLGPVIPSDQELSFEGSQIEFESEEFGGLTRQDLPNVDPFESLAWLAEHLAKQDSFIPAGALVLTGALIPPQKVPADCTSLTASVPGLGAITIPVKP